MTQWKEINPDSSKIIDKGLKFRAWDKNHNKMIYEWSENPSNYGVYTVWEILDYFEDEDIMQFTWIYDKYWKRIYTWDIIKNYGFVNTYVVKSWEYKRRDIMNWDMQVRHIWYYAEHIPMEDYPDRKTLSISSDDFHNWIIIIWNVYENPELLSA